MKLAVSNIAWPEALEEEALPILESAGIRAIEAAPTRFWPEWEGASVEEACAIRRRFRDRGLSIPALQAILFAKPCLQLFGTDGQRQELRDHLRFCASLARSMGARSLVFGAPKNRRLHGLPLHEAFSRAREFFQSAARDFEDCGVGLCLEANPVQYGCEFLTDSAAAADLVRAVERPGFRLHLDTACLHLAGEDISAAVRRSFDVLQHFHVSEPFLGTFDAPAVDHRVAACALRDLDYQGWVSLEMRPASLEQLRGAVEFLVRVYG